MQTQLTAVTAATACLMLSLITPQADAQRPGETRGRAIAQQLLDEFAVPNSDAAASGGTTLRSPQVDLSRLAGRQRAQAFLDQYAPGELDLNRPDLGLALPSRAQTKSGSHRSELHRLAANEAAAAYRSGNVERAARWIKPVVAEQQDDGELRQFESLILVAQGDFHEAAAAATDALVFSEPWNRSRLLQFHESPEQYVAVFERLHQFVTENPENSDGLLLLTYHERMLGRTRQAEAALNAFTRLSASASLSDAVLRRLGHTSDVDSLLP